MVKLLDAFEGPPFEVNFVTELLPNLFAFLVDFFTCVVVGCFRPQIVFIFETQV